MVAHPVRAYCLEIHIDFALIYLTSDWNRQARNYNGAIDSSKIRLKPLIDVFNGNYIADFPASIEDLEDLGCKSALSPRRYMRCSENC